jgi:gamma-glutamyl hydrolase
MLTLLVLLAAATTAAALDNRPVIGVVAQPTPSTLTSYGASFFPASYVKYIESAGARAIPLRYDSPRAELDRDLKRVNGVWFPGGSSHISGTSAFANAARHLFASAVDAGLPVWGTCMGFQQVLLYSSSGGRADPGKVLSEVDAESIFLPLTWGPGVAGSSLYKALTATAAAATLESTNSTINLHHFGVLTKSFAADAGLVDKFRVLSTNFDRGGKEFVSLVEHKTLPIVASQFHPEKNAYEFDQVRDMPAAMAGG